MSARRGVMAGRPAVRPRPNACRRRTRPSPGAAVRRSQTRVPLFPSHRRRCGPSICLEHHHVDNTWGDLHREGAMSPDRSPPCMPCMASGHQFVNVYDREFSFFQKQPTPHLAIQLHPHQPHGCAVFVYVRMVLVAFLSGRQYEYKFINVFFRYIPCLCPPCFLEFSHDVSRTNSFCTYKAMDASCATSPANACMAKGNTGGPPPGPCSCCFRMGGTRTDRFFSSCSLRLEANIYQLFLFAPSKEQDMHVVFISFFLFAATSWRYLPKIPVRSS
jgi:hypothetical protein